MRVLILLLWSLAGFTPSARAQLLPQALPAKQSLAPPSTPTPKPQPEPEKGSPRLAYLGFLDAINADDPSAASYLDPRGLKKDDDAVDLAQHLAEVMGRQLRIYPDDISELATGNLDDGLPAYKERLGTINLLRRAVPIDLVRSPRGVTPAWRFAPETVRAIPELYDRYGDSAIAKILPAVLYEHEFLEVRLWQWLGLLLGVFAAYVTAWGLARLMSMVALKATTLTKHKMAEGVVRKGSGPGRLLLGLGLFWMMVLALRLDQTAYGFVAGVLTTLVIFAVVWALFRIADILSEVAGRRFLATGRNSIYALLPLGRKTVKVMLGAIACLAMLQTFGVNVTTLVAGLGVGGLAVALAAQKTIENFFGGIVISVDQPVRVGEFCKFGNQVGTVEDIGLRSVRLRTLDRTIVTVSNAEFANMQLENFAARDKIRFNTVLSLRYETSAEQMRGVLIGVRQLLASHPKVLPDPLNVRFTAFNSSSLDIEIFTYIGTADWNEFLAIREDIYLQLMDVVADQGTGFALPSTTTYYAADPGLSDVRVKSTKRDGSTYNAPSPAFN